MSDNTGDQSGVRIENEYNVPAKNKSSGVNKGHVKTRYTENRHNERGYIKDVVTENSKVIKVQKTNDDAGADNCKQKNGRLKMKAQQGQNANHSIYG